jgi:hypothetical protein
MKPIIATLCAAILCSACHVSNRLYNPADRRLLPPSDPQPTSIVRVEQNTSPGGSRRIDRPDPGCNPADPADPAPPVCLAFVEFDEQGELWDRQQPTAALDLVDRAQRRTSDGKDKGPVVVTFTHGWKNNADDRDDDQNHNVVGFEGVLDYLKDQYPGHPIVGIYIGWRGALVPEFWPVREQFSYFNREGTAVRIPGPSMTSFLIRLMTSTHREGSGTHLILVGHSFGALVLERALSQAMTDYVLRQTTGAGAETVRARADLVVFVNSAASANEGKQMLNLLKDQVTYESRQSSEADELHRPVARPLFVSISSLGDVATRFAVPIGHGLSFLGFKNKGSWRDYGPQAEPPSVTAQSAYYLSTTAHMEALQSHVIVDPKISTDVQRCATDASGSPRYFGPSFQTTTAHTYQICEKRDRWNDTPYWAMQMPATVVPDHSGIFNVNFLTLMKTFFPNREEMADPGLRPTLRPMAASQRTGG